MAKTAQAIYDEMTAIDTLMHGVDYLFERKGDLALLLHKGEPLFEKLMVQWDHEGVGRLPQLESAVRAWLKEGKRDAKQRSAKAKSLVSGLAVDTEPGGPWPRPLGYSSKFGDDAVNGKLFLGARPARIITSADVPYSLGPDGIWKESDVPALRAEIRATDPTSTLGAAAVGSMVQSIKDISHTSATPFEWLVAPEDAPQARDLILFRNGLLDLNTGELLPLDGSYFATATPAFDYDPEAECPTWLTWLSERLDPSYIPTLQEWFGFCMVPDISAQRFASFIGRSRTGKGTSKTVLEGLVGAAHVGSSSMGDLGSRFGLMSFVDTRLQVFPDAKDAPAQARSVALERLLAITGGDVVGIDRKNKAPINVKLVARILILGNEPPHFLDESGALAARQIMIRWEKSFIGQEDQRVGDALMEELPGIANWAIEGLRRLRANGYIFTVGREGRAAVEKVKLAGAPALRFANDCLIVTGKSADYVTMDKVFASYRAWMHREGLAGSQRRNKTQLGADLETALANVRVTQPRHLVAPRGWTGGEYRPRILTGVSGFTRGEEDWEE